MITHGLTVKPSGSVSYERMCGLYELQVGSSVLEHGVGALRISQNYTPAIVGVWLSGTGSGVQIVSQDVLKGQIIWSR